MLSWKYALIAALFSSFFPSISFCDPAFTNGNFEASGGSSTGWEVSPNNGSWYIDTMGINSSHSFTDWFGTGHTAGYPVTIAQNLSGTISTSGTVYTISGYVEHDSWGGTQPPYPQYSLKMLVGGRVVAKTGIMTTPAGRAWAQHSLTYTSQASDIGTTVRLEISMYRNNSINFSFRLDNFSISTQAPVTLSQLRSEAGKRFWRKYSGNPVLSYGSPADWDGGAVGSMTVAKVGDIYHMYYEGWADAGGTLGRIYNGHATSLDGVHWTKDPLNPVIKNDALFDSSWDPFVLYEDGIIKMWFGASNTYWWYCESADGSHFSNYTRISPKGAYEDEHVIHDDATGRYYMYYWDRDHEPNGLYLATSPNETDFDFANATPIRIDGLLYPKMYKFTHVFKEGGTWYMYFSDFVRTPCRGSQTGYATSPDGIVWKAQNLSLLVGQDPDVHKFADNLYVMYYGPDNYFDQYHNQVMMAIYEGRLDDLKADTFTPYAHWSFDDNHGTTVTEDTLWGNDGALAGMDPATAWVPGKFHSALNFNGTGGFVSIIHPDNFDFERNFTWAAWIKTTGGGTIIARAPATGDWAQGGKCLYVTDGKLRFDLASVGYVEANSKVNDGAWHHVGITAKFGVTNQPMDSSGFNDVVTLYVDGDATATKSNWDLNIYHETGQALKIGAAASNFGGPFSGIIDDVLIYDQALSPSQMKNLAQGAEVWDWPLYQ